MHERKLTVNASAGYYRRNLERKSWRKTTERRHGMERPKTSQATAHFVAFKAGYPHGKRFFRIQLELVGHGGCLISRSHDVYNISGQSGILLAMVSAPRPLTMAFTTVSKKQTLYAGSVRPEHTESC